MPLLDITCVHCREKYSSATVSKAKINHALTQASRHATQNMRDSDGGYHLASTKCPKCSKVSSLNIAIAIEIVEEDH